MSVSSDIARNVVQDDMTTPPPAYLTAQQKGIAVGRILFGVSWAVAAILKWQPAFISTFASTIAGASRGQPAIIQAWISLWQNIVHLNPVLFAILAAFVESLLAVCFLFGVFTNLASLIGMVWSFIVWSVPDGFGGPYVAGQSTDIGTAFPYILLCFMFLLFSSGRYLGFDRLLTVKLGRFGFLATGPIRRKSDE